VRGAVVLRVIFIRTSVTHFSNCQETTTRFEGIKLSSRSIGFIMTHTDEVGQVVGFIGKLGCDVYDAS
jgi:hypothetical protein